MHFVKKMPLMKTNDLIEEEAKLAAKAALKAQEMPF